MRCGKKAREAFKMTHIPCLDDCMAKDALIFFKFLFILLKP